MKLSHFARMAALGVVVLGSHSLGRSAAAISPADGQIAQVGYCDCGQADCGCETAVPSGGCDGACGESCDGECSGIFDGGCGCQTGEPLELLGRCGLFHMGGWAQLGYHDANLLPFNNYKNNFQLQQGWVYAEKEVDMVNGGYGGRIDYIYGTDGPDTQAFGIDNGHWDNQWDNGSHYGHAIPQAYLEMGYADLRVKAGHFYTIIGHEVVQAPNNFFYSHAYTFNFSEPFTHTGVLFTCQSHEDLTVHGGYVMGWDSGFEDNGDAYLGGASISLTEDISVAYASTVGRFADNAGGNERGYMQSIVASMSLTDKIEYIFQTDVLDTEDQNGLTVRDTFAINQYLIHSINDCVSIGARIEWWQVQGDSRGFYGDNSPPGFVGSGDVDVYDLTLGMNLKPHANVVVRPEIRWDWVQGDRNQLGSPGGADIVILENNEDRQTTFGIDAIFLF
jgi:hypothetical protein